MPRVNIPNIGGINFPDDMSQEDIQRTIQTNLPKWQAQAFPTPEQTQAQAFTETGQQPPPALGLAGLLPQASTGVLPPLGAAPPALKDIPVDIPKELQDWSPPSPSTIRLGSIQAEAINQNRPTLIPFYDVAEQRELAPPEAVARAVTLQQRGIQFPSFASNEAADTAAQLNSEAIGSALASGAPPPSTQEKAVQQYIARQQGRQTGALAGAAPTPEQAALRAAGMGGAGRSFQVAPSRSALGEIPSILAGGAVGFGEQALRAGQLAAERLGQSSFIPQEFLPAEDPAVRENLLAQALTRGIQGVETLQEETPLLQESKETLAGGLRQPIVRGAKSAVTSAIPLVSGFLAGGLPAAITAKGGLFGAAEYQQAGEDIEKFNKTAPPEEQISPDLAQKIQLIRGGSEAGFEALSDLIGGKLLGFDRLVPAAKETVLRTVLTPGVRGALLKLAGVTTVEVPSEMATAGAQAFANRMGKLSEETPLAAAFRAAPEAMVASLLLGGAGVGATSLAQRNVRQALEDPAQPNEARLSAIETVADGIDDTELAADFKLAAGAAVARNEAIPLDLAVGEIAEEPQQEQAAAEQQQAAVDQEAAETPEVRTGLLDVPQQQQAQEQPSSPVPQEEPTEPELTKEPILPPLAERPPPEEPQFVQALEERALAPAAPAPLETPTPSAPEAQQPPEEVTAEEPTAPPEPEIIPPAAPVEPSPPPQQTAPPALLSSARGAAVGRFPLSNKERLAIREMLGEEEGNLDDRALSQAFLQQFGEPKGPSSPQAPLPLPEPQPSEAEPTRPFSVLTEPPLAEEPIQEAAPAPVREEPPPPPAEVPPPVEEAPQEGEVQEAAPPAPVEEQLPPEQVTPPPALLSTARGVAAGRFPLSNKERAAMRTQLQAQETPSIRDLGDRALARAFLTRFEEAPAAPAAQPPQPAPPGAEATRPFPVPTAPPLPETPAQEEVVPPTVAAPPQEPQISPPLPQEVPVVEPPLPQEATPTFQEPQGRQSTVRTERGTEVTTRFAVVEADDLIASNDTSLRPNPAYPQELQPRNRSRVASEDQVNRIAQNLQPEFLGDSPKAADGAPIVGNDQVVESGNGRVIALRRAYTQQLPTAKAYRQWLADNATNFGLSPEQIQGLRNPVLVRRRETDLDRSQFVQEANEQTTAAMSAVEQAKQDAGKLTGDLMSQFVPADDGRIDSPTNRGFIRSFLQSAVAPTERGRYLTDEGVLSTDGQRRIRNAVFAKAYGDSEALARLAEDPDDNIRTLTNAMLVAAPRLAKMKEGISQGTLFPLDLTPEIAAAADKLSTLRRQGDTVTDYFNQSQMFGEGLSPLAKDLLRAFDHYSRSSKKLLSILQRYADAVDAVGDPRQSDIFGGRTIPTPADVLQAAIDIEESVDVQTALFSAQPTSRGEAQAAAPIETAGASGVAPATTTAPSPEARAEATPPLVSPVQEADRPDQSSLLSDERGFVVTDLFTALKNEGVRGLKKYLGTREEHYQAILGDKKKGTDFYRREFRFQVERESGNTEIATTVGEQLTNEGLWNALTKVPYIGTRGAAKIGRFLRNLPRIGERFGVSSEEQAPLFDTVEAIKELDQNGDPVFGTTKWPRNPDGSYIIDPATNMPRFDWRFTPEQGQQLWDDLSDQAKDAAKFAVVEREQLKQAYKVAGDIEGYMHHFYADKGFLDGFRKLRLRYKTASSRKLRTEQGGYVRDFEQAFVKSWRELNHEAAWNQFIKDVVPLITDPIDPAVGVTTGWKEIPASVPSRKGRYLAQVAGGRQIPAELYDDLVRYVEPGAEVSRLADVTTALGRFVSGSLLVHPATAARNILSGGIQYGTFVTENMNRAILMGQAEDFKRFFYSIMAPIDAFRPSTIANIPPEMFGAKSNIVSQFGGGGGGSASTIVDKLNAVQLKHYGMIENYWKRAIAASELRAQGISINKDIIGQHTDAFDKMSEAVDTWAFNYHNEPRTLEKFKQSALGSVTSMYITYPYKLTRLYGRYIGGPRMILEGAFRGDPQQMHEGLIRTLTLGSILSLAYLATDDDEERTGPYIPGMPSSLDKTGRMRVEWENLPFGEAPIKRGAERYYRVADMPWLGFFQALNEGADLLGGESGTSELGSFLDTLIPAKGPLLQGLLLASGARGPYETYVPTDVLWARWAKPFIPFSRIAEGVRTLPGGPRTLSRNFEEEIAKAIPLPQSWTGLDLPTKIQIDPVTKQPVILNPTLEQMKFFWGVNLKDIDPRAYIGTKQKMLFSAVEALSTAQTVDKLESAFSRFRAVDPQKAKKIEARVNRQRIKLKEQEQRLLDQLQNRLQKRRQRAPVTVRPPGIETEAEPLLPPFLEAE